MLIPNDGVTMLNTFSVMIIFILLLLLSNLHLKLLSTHGIGVDKLLSTQRVKERCSLLLQIQIHVLVILKTENTKPIIHNHTKLTVTFELL